MARCSAVIALAPLRGQGCPAMVLLKVPATPPTVRVVVTVVPGEAEAVWRTHTDCPGLRVPALLVKEPEQPIECSPLRTVMAAALRASDMPTLQVPARERASGRPANVEPGAGLAVSGTLVPDTNVALQVPPQSIPPGQLAAVPFPFRPWPPTASSAAVAPSCC